MTPSEAIVKAHHSSIVGGSLDLFTTPEKKSPSRIDGLGGIEGFLTFFRRGDFRHHMPNGFAGEEPSGEDPAFVFPA